MYNTCNTEQAYQQLLHVNTMKDWQLRFGEKLGVNYDYSYLKTVGHNTVGNSLGLSSSSIKFQYYALRQWTKFKVHSLNRYAWICV
jgi:hypothetical protein